MSISLDEKRDIIYKNKDPSIAALNAVLDSYYNLLSPYMDDMKLNEEKISDEVIRRAARDIYQDIFKFEAIRKRLKDNSELSKLDVAYIGVAFNFCLESANKKIEAEIKARDLIKEILSQILSPEDVPPSVISTEKVES